ncbi:Na/Pi symporter [Acanthopleuribacter pedis]|uniref:Na/Pi symporter n=1 Tax=Acanthopleuribacter pedis TaxID=442870 RepID=UPI001FAEC79E|nr:Na/Pi symporter [Acanthopleuribacter pedis]
MAIVALIYLLLVAVGTIGSGFKWASGGAEGAERLFAFATNPFMGLLMGSLGTALVQSSSTVTSVIVGLVAGGLPVSTAIPMIMGANIGTTVTNTLVSLGHIGEKSEFRRAFSAATVHDFFNLMAVVIFLPLEMATGLLEKIALWLSEIMTGSANLDTGSFNLLKAATKPVSSSIRDILSGIPEPFGGILMILIGILLIFFSIYYMGKLLKQVMVGRAKAMLHAAIGRGPVAGVFSGTVVTVLVQSSSTTTSLAVPLAGSGVFGLKEIYPFTLGANIGTTITALLAATAISGGNAVFAMEIALVHMLYNTFAVFLIYSVPFLRNIPLVGAQKLADLAAERKALAIGYIVFVFFVIPLICVGISMLF